MAKGIRTGNPRGFKKGRSSKFHEGSWVRQSPEEGQRTYRPKCCGNNYKDEDNSPKILNDKNKIIYELRDLEKYFSTDIRNLWSLVGRHRMVQWLKCWTTTVSFDIKQFRFSSQIVNSRHFSNGNNSVPLW